MKRSADNIRPAAVAGTFYPAQLAKLARMVAGFLEQSPVQPAPNAKAVVAPHAGYVFSGPIAGSAFRSWAGAPQKISRVVLLGPSHYADFRGIALPESTGFATPLGTVPIDMEGVRQARALRQVRCLETAHQDEHCLEVELPFLLAVAPGAAIVPLLVGEAGDDEVSAVVEALWGGEETRFVVSSDLSHYNDYETARQTDRATAAAIEGGRPEEISARRACGHMAIRGFLKAAARRGLSARTLDLRNSGDTGGGRDSVVGYGAFVFENQGRDPS
jgi:AmmeMemoRadiSam system protein B